jgi:hypothetical protein
MVKTLAKPMHYHRSLNCRASGLLEQSDEHRALGPPLGQWLLNRSGRVIASVIAIEYDRLNAAS